MSNIKEMPRDVAASAAQNAHNSAAETMSNIREMLDVVDKQGNPTGEIIDRETAHERGILHRTSHVWLLRKRPSGTEVLLQKRSSNKDSYPGCYDISSAGHIPAGCSYTESALRELSEELGITGISESDLIFCGQRYIEMDNIFHGKEFHDRQVSNIYCLWIDAAPEALMLQESEVESVLWMNLDECKAAVASADSGFKHCIYLEELEMLKV